ncbi:glutamyl-tRNA amidotransferase, subunit, putative [Theileria annulata]|uniref:Glutamyl-tRNA amidotransferase, subunit, putative n=1 Tax=Theileria annulata TaxID=5874 RepID=Q4U8G3_THEAN|nr:glutamyl-tRNA amidotransferase, subunit, putative [Theileria annulata]CAI76890.1 glutamyl-tRNA amidotransferase, subunit, putative [Theileria annulata]|eukprot:XP_953515.1 glutamyl-tRNA amidotransferase, subunit, putative [Theileria annulata]
MGLMCNINNLKESRNYTDSEINNYIEQFLHECSKFTEKPTHNSFQNTKAWKYIKKCLETIKNQEEVDPEILDENEAYSYVLNNHQIFDQIVTLVDRINAGERDKMPLFGLPLAVKDNVTVKGIPLKNGATTGPYMPSFNATAVDSLVNAGIILVGKTKLNGFGLGANTTNVKSIYGEKYIVGGSSGGSGVAVGGNSVTCAIGSDTGGSVRCPAAFCNSVGYRPSKGLISRFGLNELSANFDTVGFITNTVYEAAYLTYITSGYDIKDMLSEYDSNRTKQSILTVLHNFNTIKSLLLNIIKEFKILVGPLDNLKGLKNVKIGIFDAEEICKLGFIDEENKVNMENVARITSELGAEVVKLSIPPLDKLTSIYYLETAKQTTTNIRRFNQYPYSSTQINTVTDLILSLEKRIQERFLLGEYVKFSEFDIETLLKDERENMNKWVEENKLFSEVEFFISPSTSEVLPIRNLEFESKNVYMLDLFLTIAPILGLCSLALPLRNSNRPNSLHITAGYLQDHRLFEVSNIFEEYLKAQSGST